VLFRGSPDGSSIRQAPVFDDPDELGGAPEAISVIGVPVEAEGGGGRDESTCVVNAATAERMLTGSNALVRCRLR
jgi:hypothetical protein